MTGSDRRGAAVCGGGQLCAHAFEGARPLQARPGQARRGLSWDRARAQQPERTPPPRPAPLSPIDSSRALLASPRLGCSASRPFHGPPSLSQCYSRCATRTLSFENRALNPDRVDSILLSCTGPRPPHNTCNLTMTAARRAIWAESRCKALSLEIGGASLQSIPPRCPLIIATSSPSIGRREIETRCEREDLVKCDTLSRGEAQLHCCAKNRIAPHKPPLLSRPIPSCFLALTLAGSLDFPPPRRTHPTRYKGSLQPPPYLQGRPVQS